MGQSLIHGMPVNRLISECYWLTATISFASLVFVFVVAVPIGIYSATTSSTLPATTCSPCSASSGSPPPTFCSPCCCSS